MNELTSIKDLIPREVDCQFEFKELDVGDDVFLNICVLNVVGDYPSGSAGAHIGEYLRGLSVFLREVYNLDSLILDLSRLKYSWGNNLLRSVAPEVLENKTSHDTWIGHYVIGSEQNKDALFSLFCEFGKESGIQKIYLSQEEAMEDILIRGKNIVH